MTAAVFGGTYDRNSSIAKSYGLSSFTVFASQIINNSISFVQEESVRWRSSRPSGTVTEVTGDIIEVRNLSLLVRLPKNTLSLIYFLFTSTPSHLSLARPSPTTLAADADVFSRERANRIKYKEHIAALKKVEKQRDKDFEERFFSDAGVK